MIKKWLRHLLEFLTPANDHPEVTHRRLSPEEIERYRKEMQLTAEQVEKLRQGLPIRLSAEQQSRGHQPVQASIPQSHPVPRTESKEAPQDYSGVAQYYAAVNAQKWRGIPEDMRGGLRMDRWGTLYEKNPAGNGWREKGSEDDYEVKPNSSW